MFYFQWRKNRTFFMVFRRSRVWSFTFCLPWTDWLWRQFVYSGSGKVVQTSQVGGHDLEFFSKRRELILYAGKKKKGNSLSFLAAVKCKTGKPFIVLLASPVQLNGQKHFLLLFCFKVITLTIELSTTGSPCGRNPQSCFYEM